MSSIVIPRRIIERLKKEAEKLGVSLDEYIVELLTRESDPRDKALEYVDAAYELIDQARSELTKSNISQAAEKIWGAAALTIKAYAWWKEGKRLVSHRELWEYKDKLAEEYGEWIDIAWAQANSMHTCFYEGWCSRRSVEIALKHVERLVREISSRIRG